jgi:DNA-binding NarL/FixJ family response regulator
MVIVEDEEPVRRGVRLLVGEALPRARIEVFASGQPAVEYCRRERVHLLLTDLGLPDMHGLDVIRQARAGGRLAHVIVMTGSPTDDLPRELWDLGVAGFIDKTSLSMHLRAALERVLAGGMYFSAKVTPSRLAAEGEATTSVPDLSDREREVARLVATGLLSKEIAAQLHLSPRTVEKHRASVMHKIGARSVPQLVYWCLHHGLV